MHRFSPEVTKKITPEIYFSEDEVRNFKKKFINLKKYYLTHSETKTSMTENKSWPVNRIQEIIDGNPLNWFQIGSKDDKKLYNAHDLRGKTNIRELIYVISQAKGIMVMEGLYNHIASCFGVPTIIMGTGYSSIPHSSYSNNYNLVNKESQNLNCYPCFQREKCQNNMLCVSNIKNPDLEEIFKKINYETTRND